MITKADLIERLNGLAKDIALEPEGHLGPENTTAAYAARVIAEQMEEIELLRAEVERLRGWLIKAKFRYGDRVRKISGSPWQGVVRGYYSTTLTPEGYAVESEREPGSVQIYPAAALEKVDE